MLHGDPEAPLASPPLPAGAAPDPVPDGSAASRKAELAVLELAVALGCPDCISIQTGVLVNSGTPRAAFCEALQKSIDAAGPLAMMGAARAMDRFDELTA
ncbi:carboxymuconolactone decarboxylase family protein [Leisingera sp. JC11]|uniref:carboxymuconolactone decarboxylase family protein n=1 Tax=Leisingera sp. JC11 TaxID=3042469 RepID=UPI003451B111